MCGIVGIYNRNLDGAFVSKNELERMRDKWSQGPDDSGIWISDDNRIGLGHRRLSIIDLNLQQLSQCQMQGVKSTHQYG